MESLIRFFVLPENVLDKFPEIKYTFGQIQGGRRRVHVGGHSTDLLDKAYAKNKGERR